MDTSQLTNPTVKAAIEALNNQDRSTWLSLFSDDAVMTDDGKDRDLVQWSDSEIFGSDKGYITRIDNQKNNGLDLDAQFHSDKWGDFSTFFNFTLNNDKISRLDVGQQ